MSTQATDQATCQCFLNPLPWTTQFHPYNDEEKIRFDPIYTLYHPSVSLTDEEKLILNYLLDAWNLYVSLDAKHPDDDSEFKAGIHRLQEKIALRVARRVNPEVWRTYNNEQ